MRALVAGVLLCARVPVGPVGSSGWASFVVGRCSTVTVADAQSQASVRHSTEDRQKALQSVLATSAGLAGKLAATGQRRDRKIVGEDRA